jgi:S-adenosylhomocysteine hydrolase
MATGRALGLEAPAVAAPAVGNIGHFDNEIQMAYQLGSWLES